MSADVILGRDGPCFIDLNPRLVEPGNALHAGVDLVALSLAVAAGQHPAEARPGRPFVRSHQLLLAELAAAGEGRRAILREIAGAFAHTGPYRESVEELTPAAGDPLALVPCALIGVTTLFSPRVASLFTRQSVAAYALTPEAWSKIVDSAALVH